MSLSFDEAYSKIALLIDLHLQTEEAKMDRDFERYKLVRRQRNAISDELKLAGFVVSEHTP